MENELEGLDILEAAEEVDIQAWMHEFDRIYMRRSPEQRYYGLIRVFLKAGPLNERQFDEFILWLVDGPGAGAKAKAFERLLGELSPDEIRDIAKWSANKR